MKKTKYKRGKRTDERPVFDAIRKPLAPPGHPLSHAKPEEREDESSVVAASTASTAASTAPTARIGLAAAGARERDPADEQDRESEQDPRAAFHPV